MKRFPIIYLTASSLILLSASHQVLAQATSASNGAPSGPGLDSSQKIASRVNTVTLRKDDVSCQLPRYTGLAEGIDLANSWRTLAETPLLATADAEYCDGDASLELNYQIDMFGSKIVKKVIEGREVSSQAGKYVVVTVSPEAQAGAGWHITDDLQRRRDVNLALPGTAAKVRAESIGPFANNYQFWVKKPSDPDVTLVEKFPANKERGVAFNETRSLTAGVTGTIAGKMGFNNTNGSSTSNTNGSSTSNTNGSSTSNTTGVSNSNTTGTSQSTEKGKDTTETTGSSTSNTTGSSSSNTTGSSNSNTTGSSNSNGISGEVSSQLEGAIQQTNSRTLTYTGTEYTIENKSSANIAKWSWDLKLEDDAERICDYLVKRDTNTCLFTLPLLDTGWIINTNKFSAASYANFVPAFQAVFKAKPNLSKTSTFEIGASVKLASFVGTARPSWSPKLLDKNVQLVPGIDGYPDVAKLSPDVLKFAADVRTGAVQSVTESFTVDWEQPYFAPEANIRLQVVSAPVAGTPETNATLCLSANFDAQTAANLKAIDTLNTINAEGKAAMAAATAAAQALTVAQATEAAALAEYQRLNTTPAYQAYLAANRVTATATTAKTAADEAVRRAGLADKVAVERAASAQARVQTATFETCVAGKKEQVWGYDAEEKLLKSRAVKGMEYCLAYQNLDRRLSTDDAFNTSPERNAVEILPCTGLDNRQKWVLQSDGYLGTYTGADRKFLSFDVEVAVRRDKYGDPVIVNGQQATRRVPHTGMSADSNSPKNPVVKKIQALPAQL
jgi:hypothetical protein